MCTFGYALLVHQQGWLRAKLAVHRWFWHCLAWGLDFSTLQMGWRGRRCPALCVPMLQLSLQKWSASLKYIYKIWIDLTYLSHNLSRACGFLQICPVQVKISFVCEAFIASKVGLVGRPTTPAKSCHDLPNFSAFSLEFSMYRSQVWLPQQPCNLAAFCSIRMQPEDMNLSEWKPERITMSYMAPAWSGFLDVKQGHRVFRPSFCILKSWDLEMCDRIPS